MAFCPSCGTAVQGKFCPACGTVVGDAPGRAAGASGPAAGAPAAGMQDNVAGGLCYVLGLITGIIFLVLEPYNRNRAIRFHAFQSIFVHVAIIAAMHRAVDPRHGDWRGDTDVGGCAGLVGFPGCLAGCRCALDRADDQDFWREQIGPADHRPPGRKTGVAIGRSAAVQSLIMRLAVSFLMACGLAFGQVPRVGTIDFYGLRKIPAAKLRQELGVQPGDPLPPSKANVEERLTAIEGVVAGTAGSGLLRGQGRHPVCRHRGARGAPLRSAGGPGVGGRASRGDDGGLPRFPRRPPGSGSAEPLSIPNSGPWRSASRLWSRPTSRNCAPFCVRPPTPASAPSRRMQSSSLPTGRRLPRISSMPCRTPTRTCGGMP